MLLKANYKPSFIPLKVGLGTTSIKIERGQFIFGRLKASEELLISGSTIYRHLQKFEELGQIKIEPNTNFSIITICNYNTYQSKKDNDGQPSDSLRTGIELPSDSERTTFGHKEEELESKEYKEINTGGELPKYWFLKFYKAGYEDYKKVFNGQSTTEPYFNQWKEFIDFIYTEKLEEIFDCKFINPQDFAVLVTKEKFTKEKWNETLRGILGTGIKPEHNLFFRIPQFMGYGKKDYENIPTEKKALTQDELQKEIDEWLKDD